MDKAYIIVVNVDNQLYIQLAQSDQGDFCLQAFDTIDVAKSNFESFKEKIGSKSYESHISGSMGVINLRPHIIEVDKENPESLRKYIIEDKPYKIHGGMFGAFLNLHGVKVTEEILNQSVYNVAKKYIWNQ